jgi:hypothetical protein
VKITSGSRNDRNGGIDQDDVSTDTIVIEAMVAGLFGLMFGVVIYSAAIFCVVRILEWQNVFDFTISWGASLLLGLIYVVMRSVDKAFFRTRT